MRYLRRFESNEFNVDEIKELITTVLDRSLSDPNAVVTKQWESIRDSNDFPDYLIEFGEFLQSLNLEFIDLDNFHKFLLNSIPDHLELEECIEHLTWVIQIEYLRNDGIRGFRGKNVVFENGVYKLFRIDSFDEIRGFDPHIMLGYRKNVFNIINASNIIYYLFKNDRHILTYSFNRNDDTLYSFESPHMDIYSVEEIEEIDTFVYNLVIDTPKIFNSTMDIINKINIDPIMEFWEWSKNSYGQDKAKVDAQTTMTSFNSQHGYTEEGQWVRTQDGDVYIEQMSDGKYKGFDRKGNLKTGSTKDIIRTLIKKEVINESSTRIKYGCVMLYFDPELPIFKEMQELIDDKDIYHGDGKSGYGRENSPHITLLYGLHNDIEDKQIESIVCKFKMKEVVLDNINIFENEEFDVVKFEVDNEEINDMNKELTKLPYTTDFPDYNAHLTIAYTKPGTGSKYIQKLDNINTIVPNKIVYSKADGTKIEYLLKK